MADNPYSDRKIGAVAIAATLTLISPATAITRDQCSTLANAMPEAIVQLNKMQTAFTALNWDLINKQLIGPQRSQADAAQRAQNELSAALKKYTVALEDFNYQMQLCAR